MPILLLVAACAGDSSKPFELEVAPEIIHGLYPETRTILLARVTSDSDEPVSLQIETEGAEVSAAPDTLAPGEIAEFEIGAGSVAEEVPVTIVVTGTRGSVEQTVSRETRVMPFEPPADDARRLLGVFASWLEVNRPELGIDGDSTFEGRGVDPVLVVSHYQFLSDEWELGLSWHIMIPPDDWSELYLRPRAEWSPTVAFRLASRSAALEDGVVTIEEITPPAEIVR
jgi:hypothetical protein